MTLRVVWDNGENSRGRVKTEISRPPTPLSSSTAVNINSYQSNIKVQNCVMSIIKTRVLKSTHGIVLMIMISTARKLSQLILGR